MDNKNNKIKFLIFTIVWVLLLGLGMTGIIMLVLNDMISFPVFAGMVVLFIVIWFVIIHVVSRHFELDTFPDPLTKKTKKLLLKHTCLSWTGREKARICMRS